MPWQLSLSLPLLILVAVIVGVAAVALWFLVILLAERALIAFETRPLKLARRFFREHYPSERIGFVILAATEPSRWVVRVSYGDWSPPLWKCFAVGRPSEDVNELADCSQYVPRGMR
jgi:hypothetical protein